MVLQETIFLFYLYQVDSSKIGQVVIKSKTLETEMEIVFYFKTGNIYI